MICNGVRLYYLSYPGDDRVFLSSDAPNDLSLVIKASNGRALRPLDVTPSPMAACVHAALQGQT